VAARQRPARLAVHADTQLVRQPCAQRHRITLYVRRDAGEQDTVFRHSVENGIEVFYWIDRDMGYALSGAIGHREMQALADAAYRQIGH
jgi:anti-sigma factor RsiW